MKQSSMTLLLWALVLGLFLGQLIPLAQEYVLNYSSSNGNTLANGKLVGGDFVTFYQAGAMVKDEPQRLYDFEYYVSKQRDFYRLHGVDEGPLVFAYPPLVAYAFGLLPRDTLLQAYLVWSALSIFLFVGSLVLLMKDIGAGRTGVMIALLGAAAFHCFSLSCLAAGQTSALATAILTAFFLAFRRRRDLLAGFILSLSYYKPPLFLGLVLTLLFARRWRVLAGFVTGGALLVLASVFIFGAENFRYFLSQVSGYRYGQPLIGALSLPIDKGVGVLAAMEGLKLFSSSTAQVLLLIALTLIATRLGRGLSVLEADIGSLPASSLVAKERILVLFTLIVSCSLLFSIQMVVYDLSILFPFGAASIYVILRHSSQEKAVIWLLCATTALYYESFIRSIPTGALIIKGTTIAWILFTISLLSIYRSRYASTARESPS